MHDENGELRPIKEPQYHDDPLNPEGALVYTIFSLQMLVEMRKIGGLAVLNLEGLQCMYENADEILDKISKFSLEEATRKMQRIYKEPIKEKLIV